MMIVAAVVMLVLAAGVLFGAICRLDRLRKGEHKALWIRTYFCFAVFAFWCLIEAVRALVWQSTVVYLPSAAGLAGIGMFMLGSRATWVNGAPDYLNA